LNIIQSRLGKPGRLFFISEASSQAVFNLIKKLYLTLCLVMNSVRKKILFYLIMFLPATAMAQQKTMAVPELFIPATVDQWEQQRKKIRETLIMVMGDLPPQPKSLQVKILSREDKGGYTLEKFEFDNEAGAIVPGYLLIPNNGQKKHPAIYYCHWHGGNYDLGKDEIFDTHHTPAIPAETLTKAGYAVIAIDAYCFGERSGKRPWWRRRERER
jgi:hypothetical protein